MVRLVCRWDAEYISMCLEYYKEKADSTGLMKSSKVP